MVVELINVFQVVSGLKMSSRNCCCHRNHMKQTMDGQIAYMLFIHIGACGGLTIPTVFVQVVAISYNY